MNQNRRLSGNAQWEDSKMNQLRGLSDKALIGRILAGDRECFAALVDRYLPTVYSVAYAHTGNHADAEDVAQEALISAFRSLDTLRERGRFGSWIATIARNAARRFGTRRGREERIAGEQGGPGSVSPDVAARELHRIVRERVEQLGSTHAEVLLLHYFAGQATGEIASTLGISRSAVKKRLQRAREALSNDLLGELGEAVHPPRSLDSQRTAILAAALSTGTAWRASASGGLVTSALGVLLPKGATVLAGFTGMLIAAFLGAFVYVAGPEGYAAKEAGPTESTSDAGAAIAPPDRSTGVTDREPIEPPEREAATSDEATPPEQEPAVTDAVSPPKLADAALSGVPQFPPDPEAFRPYSHMDEAVKDGKVSFSARHFILSPEIRRSEFTDGRLIIFDLSNSVHLSLDEENRRATKETYADIPADPGRRHYDPIELFRMWSGGGEPTYFGSKTVDGKECHGFHAGSSGGHTLWIDKDTNLPVRTESLQTSTGRTIIGSEYVFNIDTDPERFSMEQPEGYAYNEVIVRDTWWTRLTQKAWYYMSWLGL